MRRLIPLLLLCGFAQAQVQLPPEAFDTDGVKWRVTLYDFDSPEQCIKTIAGTDTGFSITISTDVSNGAAFTYTAAGATVDAITTIGTYAEPATSNIAFEYTGSGCWYEIQPRNEVLAVTSAQRIYIDVESSADDFIDASFFVDLNVAEVADLVDATFDEACAGHVASGSVGEQICTNLPAAKDNTDTITGDDGALLDSAVGVNVTQINSNSTSAEQLALSAATIESGAAEGTPTTTVIQTDLAETDDDIYIGRVVIFTSGAARGEVTEITDYTGSTGTLTVTALANAPAAGDSFVVL